MAKDLIRLMNALFLPGMEAVRQTPWQPNTDIYRIPGGWLLKFELAGVRADDIDLQVLGNRMSLRGVRRDLVLEGGQTCLNHGPVHHRMEIAYSGFSRSIELPCDLMHASISTEFRDGLLLVRIEQINQQ